MNVVGHQTVSVDRDFTFISVLSQPIEIESTVVIGEKHRLAVVTALDDMLGNSGNMEAGSTRHGGLAKRLPLTPF